MKHKEYFTEEPLDIPGVDIPCCTGDYMDIRDNDPSNITWDEDTVEGYHYCACRRVHCLKEGEPLCDLDAVDEFTEKLSTRSMDRHDAALEADRMLDEMLQMRRENDLRLGEVLTLFKKKKGEDNLGHRSIGTFAVEHLDFSGRLASELMHNHEMFSTLQLTKEAYRQGEITKSALRHLSKVLTHQNEAEWISKARDLPLRALKRAVREAALLEAGRETVGEAGRETVGEAGRETVGEAGRETVGEAGRETVGEAGRETVGEAGRETVGEAGRETVGEAGRETVGEAVGETLNETGLRETALNEAAPKETAPTASGVSDTSEKSSMSPSNGAMMCFNVSNRLAPVWDLALEHFRNKEQYNGPISRFVEALLADYITSGKRSGFGAPTPLESGMLPVFYRRYIREDERNEELLFVCPPVPDEANPHGSEDEARQHHSGDEANPHGSEDEDSDDDDEELMGRRISFPPSFYENPDTLEELTAKLIELGRNRQELDVGIGKILRAIDDWSLYRILNFSHIVEYGKEICELPKPVLYRLITLANRFRRHPLVEKAFRKKLISREQALQILRVVTAENEMIWIDYAAHVSVITLKEEVERCARIIEYDGFAFISFNILPGFRYITDDRYHELSEEMKDILRTGSWYQRSSPELSWPIEENSDERLLMEHDPCIDEPWKHFKDIDELEAYKAGIAGTAGENPLCAGTGQSGADVLCAALEPASPPAKSGSNSTVHDEETLAKAREICTMPHDADPAETFLMDILRDSGDFRGVKTTMSIKFFLPEELFDLWNTVFAIWLRRSVAEEMTDETKDCDLVEVGTDTFFKKKKSQSPEGMAESFLAALLQGWLLTEKAHLKVTRDYAILKRDRFRCQVPGCNCRRNLHIHHIIWRSKGGTDDPENLLCLCEKHHLRLLHNLLTLKIEGTAPHNLTFTFGPRSHGDERPFLKYVRGRKVLTSDILIHNYHNAALGRVVGN